MNAPTAEQIELTGRIVTLAGGVEARLTECGGRGVGLREKSEALGERIPPEVGRLLAFIGNLRNRVAHEPGASVSAEEFELFQEAVATVQEELDRLFPRLGTASSPAGSPSPRNMDEEWFRTAGRIPGLHLIFACKLAADALRPGWQMLLVALVEAGGLAMAGWGIYCRIFELAGFGGSLAMCAWAVGICDGWRQRQAGSHFPLFIILIPILNFVYLAYRMARQLRWFLLAEAAVILVVWGAAIQMALAQEFPMAGILALLSYAGAVVATCINRWL